MKLHIIGTGVNGIKSMTVKGWEQAKLCSDLYTITSCPFMANPIDLQKYELSEVTEVGLDKFFNILECIAQVDDKVIGLLLNGDPFFHGLYIKLKKKCTELDISMEVIHNASPMNLVGCSGLQLYRFGETILIGSEHDFSKISNKVELNLRNQLHSLLFVENRSPDSQCNLSNLKKLRFRSPETPCILLNKSEEGLILNRIKWQDLPKEIEGNMLVVCSELHPLEEEAFVKLSDVYSRKKLIQGCNTFHLVGLGLGTPTDITLEGKRAIEESDYIFLEGYTSIMMGGTEELEKYFQIPGKITVADREMVESESMEIVSKLKYSNVVLLVVGDPLSATTHSDLLIRVVDEGYNINVINNASIMNAAGISGLPLHQFGEIVSIPFWQGSWQPESFYDKICSNIKSGWHTLCLLDIKVKEQSIENLLKRRRIYEPPRFMRVNEAAEQLLKIAQDKQEHGEVALLDASTPVISLTKVGTEFEKNAIATLEETSRLDLGDPLHSLIVCCTNDIELHKKWFLYVIVYCPYLSNVL